MCYWVHSDSYTMVRYLKRLKASRLGRVQAFPMYGGLGMSGPSLHRESTDRDVGRGLRKIVACSQPYLAVASCIYSFWHGVIPTSYFI